MTKGYKKHFADHDNFNMLQLFRNGVKDQYDVQNIKWCGNWNGSNWERLSFYCSDYDFKIFCRIAHFGIRFS